MNTNSRMTKWLTAAALLIGFLLTFFLDWTGLEWHQWLGAAVGAVAAYHGWVHRAWVISVAQRLLNSQGGLGPLYFLIDAGLLLGFVVIVATGLVISSWLGLALTGYTGWVNVHIIAALLTLGLVVVKVGTHWRWIVTTWRAERAAPRRPSAGPAAPMSAPNRSARPSRREFLGLMGMVGAAAVLASAQALSGVASQAAAAPETGAAAQTIATTSSASTCTVQCNKRCSYPGHCRRYTDANNNGRCDLGECA